MIFTTNGKRDVEVLIDDEDWPLVSQYQWWAVNQHGTIYIINRALKLHRVIMDAPNGYSVDHINGNTLDNRKGNLRICLNKDNVKNSKRPHNNTSGVKGVCWDKNRSKWMAKIKVDQRTINLGRYNDIEEANKAYFNAGRKYFGEFFRAN